MIKKALFSLFLVLAGCASQMATSEVASNQSLLEEMRIAIMDVKQSYSAQQMDLQLLEEKIAKIKTAAAPRVISPSLETRVAELEKMQEKIRADLHEISSHANETSKLFVEYRTQMQILDKRIKEQQEKLHEIADLKSTLHSISKAIQPPASSYKTHRVSSGESLNKIAQKYNTSVEELKRINALSTNTIITGQELKIPE